MEEHPCRQNDKIDFVRESMERIERKIDALFLKYDVIWEDHTKFKTTTELLLKQMLEKKSWKNIIYAGIISGTFISMVNLFTRFIK